MENYWLVRINETEEKIMTASTEDIRKIYFKLLDHYHSMRDFSPVTHVVSQ